MDTTTDALDADTPKPSESKETLVADKPNDERLAIELEQLKELVFFIRRQIQRRQGWDTIIFAIAVLGIVLSYGIPRYYGYHH